MKPRSTPPEVTLVCGCLGAAPTPGSVLIFEIIDKIDVEDDFAPLPLIPIAGVHLCQR